MRCYVVPLIKIEINAKKFNSWSVITCQTGFDDTA